MTMRGIGLQRVLISVLAMGVGLLACSRSTPHAPETFPETDIIFQLSTLWDEWNSDEDILGFINADGSNLTYLGGWRGYYFPPVLPVITGDGTLAVFRVVDLPGHASNLVLWPEGASPIACKAGMGTQRAALTADQARAVTDIVGSADSLMVVDLNSCLADSENSVGSVLELAPTNSAIEGAMSPSGRFLAFVQWIPDRRSYAVVIHDMETREARRVGEGIAPAWSPNSEAIAYTWIDGIYLFELDGVEGRKVVGYTSPDVGGLPLFNDWWPPLPSWSPDGRWLVYHKCVLPPAPKTHCGSSIDDYAIFKVNVETGEEIKILDGGLNPYWRWKDAQP